MEDFHLQNLEFQDMAFARQFCQKMRDSSSSPVMSKEDVCAWVDGLFGIGKSGNNVLLEEKQEEDKTFPLLLPLPVSTTLLDVAYRLQFCCEALNSSSFHSFSSSLATPLSTIGFLRTVQDHTIDTYLVAPAIGDEVFSPTPEQIKQWLFLTRVSDDKWTHALANMLGGGGGEGGAMLKKERKKKKHFIPTTTTTRKGKEKDVFEGIKNMVVEVCGFIDCSEQQNDLIVKKLERRGRELVFWGEDKNEHIKAWNQTIRTILSFRGFRKNTRSSSSSRHRPAY